MWIHLFRESALLPISSCGRLIFCSSTAMFLGVCRKFSLRRRLFAIPCPSNFLCSARDTAHRAAIGKIGRKSYIRRFPITVMRPDGSTIEIRASEPRDFVQLPLDLNAITEEERRHRLAARKPKVKQIKEDVIDDNFDIGQYAQLWRTTNESKEKQTKIKSKVFAVKENMNEKNSQEMDKKVKPKKGT
uniref:39S ribosomal protein L55 n=2 Tax=Ascaris TaxID=6251 RepID=F1LCJ3_ASCSU